MVASATRLDRPSEGEYVNGARLTAAGADDNRSATAALMLGAPVSLVLSRTGRLACRVCGSDARNNRSFQAFIQYTGINRWCLRENLRYLGEMAVALLR